MPDDPVVEPGTDGTALASDAGGAPPAEVVAAEGTGGPADGAPEGPAKAPHPLEPGGPRFEQVVAQKHAEKARADAAEARLATLERELAESKAKAEATTKAPTVYTPQQIQAAIDAGQVTAAEGYAYLAEQAATRATERATREHLDRQRQSAALEVVESYAERLPALRQPGSEEWRRAKRVAEKIAVDMGRSVNDPLVQHWALNAEFGPLDRLAAQRQTQERSRQMADAHVTVGGGGGKTPPASADPLKGVPTAFRDYWARQGEAPERIAAMWTHAPEKTRQRFGP